MEGAYLNRYVTDKQRSRRPIFIATLWTGASWLFFRVARSTRMTQIWALLCQSGSDRLEQPTDLGQNTSYFGDRTLDSWVFRKFPDSSPVEVARAADRTKSVDLDEYQRASWLWQRRPSDISILVHLLIFGVGALIYIPLILVDNFVVFAVYHTFYVGVVIVCVGRFLRSESRYRRWKQDYFRSLARLANEDHSRD